MDTNINCWIFVNNLWLSIWKKLYDNSRRFSLLFIDVIYLLVAIFLILIWKVVKKVHLMMSLWKASWKVPSLDKYNKYMLHGPLSSIYSTPLVLLTYVMFVHFHVMNIYLTYFVSLFIVIYHNLCAYHANLYICYSFCWYDNATFHNGTNFKVHSHLMLGTLVLSRLSSH